MNIGSLIGLVLGLIGTILVTLPTFGRIASLINDEEKIATIDQGRRKLSKQGQLSIDDPSFEYISEIIDNNWDQDLTDECHELYRPKIIFEDADQNETYNRVTTVYSINSDGLEKDQPSSEDYLQDIESILIIDWWIENKIDRLRTVRIQRIRGIGFAFIVISVFI